MIRRLLIANRGEISIRIAHACRELGIESVAVYSDADERAPHVMAADRALRIGPAPAAESYLSGSKLIAAAQAVQADAVHPGYGFLSENSKFAAACESAGLVFVGPPSNVIARMGSKIEARQTMESAGVPVVPGETPTDQSDAGIQQAIRRVGLPVLIKASAGGGGKGMRRVYDAAEIGEATGAARREATAAFGDGTLYVERLLERPRHIEVQVFADDHGHVVDLFERECSVQRRHQKVIEESPSPVVTADLRQRLAEAAVQAARAARYRNAGTVEFLIDASADRSKDPKGQAAFYFLEMNTRLQVEHPVTEAVTGLDLVRAQLLVASGETLPWLERPPTQRGHAIEARVYAEDPAREFIPQAGRVLLYREPRLPGVRVDSGIMEGTDVPVHYDPLLAKVIAYGESREVARVRLLTALRDFPILGVVTNVPFLCRILDHQDFIEGQTDTRFLEREGPALTTSIEPPAFVRAAMGAAEGEDYQRLPPGESREVWDPWKQLREWRA